MMNALYSWFQGEVVSLFSDLPISSSILFGLGTTACASLISRIRIFRKCAWKLWQNRGSLSIGFSHCGSMVLHHYGISWPGIFILASDSLVLLEIRRQPQCHVFDYALGCVFLISRSSERFLQAKAEIKKLRDKLLRQPIKTARRIFAGAFILRGVINLFMNKSNKQWSMIALLGPTFIDTFLDRIVITKFLKDWATRFTYSIAFYVTNFFAMIGTYLHAIILATVRWINANIVKPIIAFLHVSWLRIIALMYLCQRAVFECLQYYYKFILIPISQCSVYILQLICKSLMYYIVSPIKYCAQTTWTVLLEVVVMWSTFVKSHVFIPVARFIVQTKHYMYSFVLYTYQQVLVPAIQFTVRSVRRKKRMCWLFVLKPILRALSHFFKFCSRSILKLTFWCFEYILRPIINGFFHFFKFCWRSVPSVKKLFLKCLIRPIFRNINYFGCFMKNMNNWLLFNIIQPCWTNILKPLGRQSWRFAHGPLKKLSNLVFPIAVACLGITHAIQGYKQFQSSQKISWDAVSFLLSACSSTAAALLFFFAAMSGPIFRYLPMHYLVIGIKWYSLIGDLGFGIALVNLIHFVLVTIFLSAFSTTLILCDFVAQRISQSIKLLLTAVDSIIRFVGRILESAMIKIHTKIFLPAKHLLWCYVVRPVWSYPSLTLVFCFALLAALLRHHHDLVLAWNLSRGFIFHTLLRAWSSVFYLYDKSSICLASTRSNLADQLGSKRYVFSRALKKTLSISSKLGSTLIDFSIWLMAPKVTSISALLASPNFARVILVLHWLASSAARLTLFDSSLAVFSRSSAIQSPIRSENVGLSIALVRLFIKLGLAPIVFVGIAPNSRLLRAFFLLIYLIGALVRSLQALGRATRQDIRRSTTLQSSIHEKHVAVPLAVRLAAEFLVASKVQVATSEDCCPICLDKLSSTLSKDQVNEYPFDTALRWSQTATPPPDAQKCFNLITKQYQNISCTLACGHCLHFGCLVALATSSQRFSQRCPLCREPVILPSRVCQLTSSIWF